MSIQSSKELDTFYKETDPWGYESNTSDKNRKDILLAELAKLPVPERVLDIGCGHGFITREIPGKSVIGVDYSKKAIEDAQRLAKKSGDKTKYIAADMFDLSRTLLKEPKGFDQILITGVLYPQYIGNARTVIYKMIDDLLVQGGHLVSVQIDEWYTSRFPYILTKSLTYDYREYQHVVEVYEKL